MDYFLFKRTYVSKCLLKHYLSFTIEQLLEVYKPNFCTRVNQISLAEASSLTKLYHRLLSLHRLLGEDMEGGGFGVEATLLGRV